MGRMLITGFDPFGGETINPAWEAVKRLPEQIGPWEIHRLMVPTVFGEASRTALEAAQQIRPDMILCVGQAGGRKAVTPEMVAINLRFGSIADNAGKVVQDEPVVPGGPDAYFATLPVRRMAQAIADAGFAGAVSYSAGTFVCNDLMYALLHRYHGTAVRTGFVHVPFLPEQAREGVPSMALDDIVRALECAVTAIE